jgi:hypothetical protein
MLREHKARRQEDTFTQVVIVPAEAGAAIGPFDTPSEADAHARTVGIEDYTLLVVVPPRARLRVV